VIRHIHCKCGEALEFNTGFRTKTIVGYYYCEKCDRIIIENEEHIKREMRRDIWDFTNI